MTTADRIRQVWTSQGRKPMLDEDFIQRLAAWCDNNRENFYQTVGIYLWNDEFFFIGVIANSLILWEDHPELRDQFLPPVVKS